MKKLKLFVVLVAMVVVANAQEKKTQAGKAIDSTKKAINIGANAVAEVSVKGGAAILDQKLKTKVGPYGKTVYLNGKNQYYYVNKRGAKVYIKKSQLRAK